MNLTELETLAKEATAGPWFYRDRFSIKTIESEGLYLIKDTENYLEDFNAKFIADANPETVLKLIEVARAAKAFKQDFMDQYDGEPMGVELYELFEELEK